ncbi:MAG: hypothetical protein RLZZ227_1278 [Pseudomonadota bacterium]|jgi:hypothetical protein
METIKLLLQRFLLLALLLLALWFCWTNRSILAAISLPPVNLLLILLSYLFLHLLQAAMSCVLLRNRGRVVPLLSLLTLNAWFSLLGNAALLKEGQGASRAMALRQRFQVPLNLTHGLIALLALATIFTNAAAGIFTGVWGLLSLQQVVPALYWLVLSTSLLLCVSIVMGVYKLGGVNKLSRRLQIWVANLHAVFTNTNYNEVIGLIALVTLTLVPRVLALSLLFGGFDVELPLIYLIYIAIFINLFAITITPANLGIRELVVVLLVGHLDPTIVQVVCVLLVDRLLQFLVVVSLSLAGRQQLKQDKTALHAAG